MRPRKTAEERRRERATPYRDSRDSPRSQQPAGSVRSWHQLDAPCTQLHFNDDGRTLYRQVGNMVDLFDVRIQKQVLVVGGHYWTLEFMPPSDHQLITSGREREPSSEYSGFINKFKIWDVRRPNCYIGSIYSRNPDCCWQNAYYSKKEDILFAVASKGYNNSLLFFDGARFDSSDRPTEPLADMGGWSCAFSHCALSKDCSTMVISNQYNFYQVVRNLCLRSFVSDLSAFQPLSTVMQCSELEEDDFSEFYDFGEHLSKERECFGYCYRPRSDRNAVSIVKNRNFSLMEESSCQDIIIRGDCFLGQGSDLHGELFALYDIPSATCAPVSECNARHFAAGRRIGPRAVCAASEHLLAAHDDGFINVYGTPRPCTSGPLPSLTSFRTESPPASLAFSPDSRWLYVSCEDCWMRCFSTGL